jgi:hypothetical protein
MNRFGRAREMGAWTLTGQFTQFEVRSFTQSQRDCAFQPRVARDELPWDPSQATSTPTGLCLPLGQTGVCTNGATPLGLQSCPTISQGSSSLATLGFVSESLWDSPRGDRSVCLAFSNMVRSGLARLSIGAVSFLLTVLCGLPSSANAASASPTPHENRLDFPTRVLPILTKAGCNAGSCHGAAIGQGGFKLSLLGYDPDQDYESITREFSGRRVDLGDAPASLLLRKATKTLRHKGGLRIEKNSEDYRTLVAWLATGAPYGPRDLRVNSIEVNPANVLLSGPSQSSQLRVAALLSDGTAEDVTAHALYSSNDDSVADVDANGLVTVKDRGLTVIMVRYLGQVAAVRIGRPFGDREIATADFSAQNFVDEKILTELQRLRLPPSPLCGDSEFLRRVYLDVIGRPPMASEVRAFLKGPASTDKRARVVDDLLAREEFNDFWTLKLADLLQINSKRLGDGPAKVYHAWLREQVSQNARFDRLVSELLTAKGDAGESGSANFYRLNRDPRDMGEFVSRTFLGVEVACARCHAHPFAGWTQNDYHRFAAYFARIDGNGQRVYVKDRGEVQHPKTNKDVKPKPLGGLEPDLDTASDRRLALAEWLTAPQNPMFSRAIVNRVWKHLLGRGLIEPVDDVRVTNPASNPALLDALATDFAAGDFDLRRLIRTIATSRTYQLSPRANAINLRDDRFFSRAYLKPLSAQVLADAIAQVTEVPNRFPNYPLGTRAVQLIDAQTPSYTLDVFGRCPREASCESPSRFGGGLSQALHLINGSAVNSQIKGGLVNRLLVEFSSDGAMAEELYLRVLSRFPSEDELAYCKQSLANAGTKLDTLEDLLWALVNSREFAYNH